MQARGEYDASYMQNKTAQLAEAELRIEGMALNLSLANQLRLGGLNVSAFVACTSLTGRAAHCPGASAAQLVADAQERLLDQYDAASATYYENVHNLKEMAAAAERQLAEAQQILAQVEGFVGDNANLFAELDGVGIGKLLPSGAAVPSLDFHYDYDAIAGTLDAIEVPELDTSALEQYRTELEAQIQQAVDGVNVDTAALADSLGDVELELLEDHDPPSVDASAEERAHAERTAELEADVAVSLNSLDRIEVEEEAYAPSLSSSNWSAPSGSAEFDLSWSVMDARVSPKECTRPATHTARHLVLAARRSRK